MDFLNDILSGEVFKIKEKSNSLFDFLESSIFSSDKGESKSAVMSSMEFLNSDTIDLLTTEYFSDSEPFVIEKIKTIFEKGEVTNEVILERFKEDPVLANTIIEKINSVEFKERLVTLLKNDKEFITKIEKQEQIIKESPKKESKEDIVEEIKETPKEEKSWFEKAFETIKEIEVTKYLDDAVNSVDDFVKGNVQSVKESILNLVDDDKEESVLKENKNDVSFFETSILKNETINNFLNSDEPLLNLNLEPKESLSEITNVENKNSFNNVENYTNEFFSSLLVENIENKITKNKNISLEERSEMFNILYNDINKNSINNFDNTIKEETVNLYNDNTLSSLTNNETENISNIVENHIHNHITNVNEHIESIKNEILEIKELKTQKVESVSDSIVEKSNLKPKREKVNVEMNIPSSSNKTVEVYSPPRIVKPLPVFPDIGNLS